jgi:hypothetical protein
VMITTRGRIVDSHRTCLCFAAIESAAAGGTDHIRWLHGPTSQRQPQLVITTLTILRAMRDVS